MTAVSRYLGDRAFYRRVFALTVPIMVQNGITNFVSMLDNIMVGRVGTVEMTGVSVANNLLFVFSLCIFGAVSGAGIFGAQFFGRGDHQGVRYTFRFKVWFCLLLTALFTAVYFFFGEALSAAFLRGEGDPAQAAASLDYAVRYLRVMLIGLVPYALAQCWSATLRETGRAVPPMAAGIAAVAVNLVLNYVLIFGHFGAPRMGVIGAAIATVISRFAELFIVAGWTWWKRDENPFIRHAFRSFYMPLWLVKQILVKGMPLMFNESLWGAGVAMMNQCYSERGLDVVSANTIASTFWNVFSVAFLSVGVAIGILLGQRLGAGEKEEARDEARRLIVVSVLIGVVIGVIYYGAAGPIPRLYNTTDEIRSLASSLMRITAVIMPLEAFANSTYFTLRSGGRTYITILFDSCFMWAVNVSTAYLISRFTAMPILWMYAICQGECLIKDIVGYILVKKGIWIRSIVDRPDENLPAADNAEG